MERGIYLSDTENSGKVLCQINRLNRNIAFSFLISQNGDLELTSGLPTNTGVNEGTRVAIRTVGNVMNRFSIRFFALYVKCHMFLNYGQLAMQDFWFDSDYMYNSGLLVSKENPSTLPVQQFNGEANPDHPVAFRQNVFLNCGMALFSDLHLKDVEVVNKTNMNVANLEAREDPFINDGVFNCESTLTGHIPSFVNGEDSIFDVHHLDVERFDNFTNKGLFNLGSESCLSASQFSNDGLITSPCNLHLTTENPPSGSNRIVANGIIDFIVEKMKQQQQATNNLEEAKIALGQLVGQKVKYRKVTHVYINHITIYNDQFGREVSRSETGYQYDHDEVEEKEQDIPAELKNVIEEKLRYVDAMLKAAKLKMKLLEEVLKQLTSGKQEKGEIDPVLAEVINMLQEAGLETDSMPPELYELLSMKNEFIKECERFVREGKTLGPGGVEIDDSMPTTVTLGPKPWKNKEHMAKITGQIHGFSLSSGLAVLTVMRYDWEMLKEEYPTFTESITRTVKYGMALVGFVKAFAVFVATAVAYDIPPAAVLVWTESQLEEGLTKALKIVGSFVSNKIVNAATTDPELRQAYSDSLTFLSDKLAERASKKIHSKIQDKTLPVLKTPSN